MGQAITYEVGQLNIGRQVRVLGDRGFAHGYPATLSGASKDRAAVKSPGRGEHFVDWANVRDWTSKNETALAKPGSRPKPIAATKVQVPVAVTPPPVATAGNPFAVYATLGERCERATGEVAAAEELLDQALEQVHSCRAAHEEAVASLNTIRKEAAAALAQIDTMLGGTVAAIRPQNGVAP